MKQSLQAQSIQPNSNSSAPFIMVTMGPSCKHLVLEMILKGVTMFRFNCSHAKNENDLNEIISILEYIKGINEDLGLNVQTLVDLGGPKIRSEDNVDEIPITLEAGKEIMLTTRHGLTNRNRIGVKNYEQLATDVRPGHRIFIDDSRIELLVKRAADRRVWCDIIRGGVLTSRKGINLPDTFTSLPALTATDIEHVNFFLTNAPFRLVSFFGLSFVQNSADILRLRELIKGTDIGICAKIERPLAVWQNLGEIVSAASIVMIARGDLSSEIPIIDLPQAQRRILKMCKEAQKPVILATSVLRSMEESTRPTIGDNDSLYQAILDGYDVIMLSNETSVGRYPLECVQHIIDMIVTIDRQRASITNSILGGKDVRVGYLKGIIGELIKTIHSGLW